MGVRDNNNKTTEIKERSDFYADIEGTVHEQQGGTSLERLLRVAASLGANVFVSVVAMVLLTVMGCKEVSRFLPYACVVGVWLVQLIFAAVERGKHGTTGKRKR